MRQAVRRGRGKLILFVGGRYDELCVREKEREKERVKERKRRKLDTVGEK